MDAVEAEGAWFASGTFEVTVREEEGTARVGKSSELDPLELLAFTPFDVCLPCQYSQSGFMKRVKVETYSWITDRLSRS